MLLDLAIASTFCIAASVTFPRLNDEEIGKRIHLDAHFREHRSVVFGCILAANAMVWLLQGGLAAFDADWARV